MGALPRAVGQLWLITLLNPGDVLSPGSPVTFCLEPGRGGAGHPVATVNRSAFSCRRLWAGAKGAGGGRNSAPLKIGCCLARSTPPARHHAGPGASLAGELLALPGVGRQDKRRGGQRPRGVPCPEHVAFPRRLPSPALFPAGLRQVHCAPSPRSKQGTLRGVGGIQLPHRGAPPPRPSQHFVLGATEQGQAPRGAGCIGFPPRPPPTPGEGDERPRTQLPAPTAAPVVGSFVPVEGGGSGFVAQVRGGGCPFLLPGSGESPVPHPGAEQQGWERDGAGSMCPLVKERPMPPPPPFPFRVVPPTSVSPGP